MEQRNKKKNNNINKNINNINKNINNKNKMNTTVHGMIKQYVQHVKNENKNLNALVWFNPHFLEQMKHLQETHSMDNDAKRKLLYKTPFIVKDSILTKYGPSHCGTSRAFHSMENAPCVQALEDHGAVVLAKSNVPFLCNDIQTFNPIYGKTSNPYDPLLTCGGSSGGSACAVTMKWVPLALGSDMAGSLRIPSSFCGCFAIRPSIQRALLSNLSGGSTDSGHVPPSPLQFNNKQDLKYYCTPLSVIGAIAESIDYLDRFLQCCLVDYHSPFNANERSEPSKLLGDLKIAVTPYVQGIPIDYRIVKCIYEFLYEIEKKGANITTNDHPPLDWNNLKYSYTQLVSPMTNAALKIMNPNQSDMSLKYDEQQYNHAMEIQKTQQKIIDQYLESYDIWILPISSSLPFHHNPKQTPIQIQEFVSIQIDTTTPTTTTITSSSNVINHCKFSYQKKEMPYWKNIAFCSSTTVLGNPVISFPIGMAETDHGTRVPVGVQLIGKRDQEEKLIQAARMIESHFGPNELILPPNLPLPSKI